MRSRHGCSATFRECTYVLSVKDNQPRLLEDIQLSFAQGFETDFANLESSYHQEVYKGHGRVERHSIYTILHPDTIRDVALWRDLQAITLIVSETEVAGKETTTEARYYIGSKVAKAKAYAGYVRSHWGIESGLHWVLDVCFDEDGSRMRTDHSAENMALLRRLALCLLKRHGAKGSIRGKRLQSGWDNDFVLNVLRSNQ